MSEIVKDLEKIWNRLFDHKGFLVGEINFLLNEFEQSRNDKEVDNLFLAIEDITEIKDTEINRCKQIGDHTLEKTQQDLKEALEICDKFKELEKNIQEKTNLEEIKQKRKIEWDIFMGDITTKYAEINNNYEAKELELVTFYEDIEKKLLV